MLSIGDQVTAQWLGEELRISSMKLQILLARLALSRQAVSRQTMARELWGTDKRNNLRQLLHRARKLPGAGSWLIEETSGLSLAADVVLVAGCDRFADIAQVPFLDDLLSHLEPRGNTWRLANDVRTEGIQHVAPHGALEAGGDRADNLEVAGANLISAGTRDDARANADRLLAANMPNAAARVLSELGDPDAWIVATDPVLRGTLALPWLSRIEREPLERHVEAIRSVAQIQYLDARTAAELDMRRSVLAMRQNRQEVASDLAREAIALAQAGDWPRVEFRARLTLGQLALRRGENAAALFEFEQLQPSCEEDQLLSLAATGAVLGLMARVQEALDTHKRALTVARRVGSSDQVALALLNVGCDLVRLGRFRTAMVRFGDAADLANGTVRSRSLANAAMSAHAAGDLGLCRNFVGKGLAAAKLVQSCTDLGLIFDTRAALEASCGRTDEAVHWCGRAAMAHREGGSVARALLSRINAACWTVESGQTSTDEARSLLDEFRSLGRPMLFCLAKLELALFCPVEEVAVLVEEGLPEGASLRLRGLHELARARFVEPEKMVQWLANQPGHLQPLAVVTCEHWGLPHPALSWVLDERSAGLLQTQREGLAARALRFSDALRSGSATPPVEQLSSTQSVPPLSGSIAR